MCCGKDVVAEARAWLERAVRGTQSSLSRRQGLSVTYSHVQIDHGAYTSLVSFAQYPTWPPTRAPVSSELFQISPKLRNPIMMAVPLFLEWFSPTSLEFR